MSSAIAIVVFRESLEIALIISVVLAATKGLAGRMKWIILGFLAGIGGAALVAKFTSTIAEFAEGVGQELMNASILLVAAFFIGWTVVWMKKHARGAANKLKQVGTAVKEGEMPFYSLSIVIALAVLREGAEIVLFTYGRMAAGDSVNSIIIGSVTGGISGLLLGIFIYLGLIQLSTRWLFTITSWILMLLVAGLVSQAAGYLVQAGYFSAMSNVLWDTSHILSNEGTLGETLKVLIGYNAKPMLIQLIFYIGTLALLLATLKLIDKYTVKKIPSETAGAA